MDNLVTIYHGGTVESDCYGYVEFVDNLLWKDGVKDNFDLF